MLKVVNGSSAMKTDGVKLNRVWQEAVSSSMNNTEILSEYHALAQELHLHSLQK